MPDLRVYGVSAAGDRTFYFPFLDPDSSAGDYLTSTPTLSVANDLAIYKDGVDTAVGTATLSWVGDGYGKIVLDAAHLQAKIVVAIIIDATATKEWVDTSIIIHTGGHASALHSG